MMLISESLLLDFYLKQNEETNNFKEFVNKKQFTVKNTSLSHRQVNSLDSDGMLNTNRDDESKWRKFSFKDIVYLLTIKECRKYGLKNSQIKELRKDFYKTKGTREYSAVDQLLIMVLGKIKISICILSNGEINFVDNNNVGFLDRYNKSYLYINFNEIVRQVWNSTFPNKKDNFPKYISISDIIDEDLLRIAKNENKILGLLRNEDYTKIIIRKGKKEYIVSAESENKDKITEEELLKRFKSKDFSDIEVKRRDGKVVSFKQEEIFKVNIPEVDYL